MKKVIAWLLTGMLLSTCFSIVPGAVDKKEATANVQTFEDVNRNGKWDSGEAALPETLIAAYSNSHGLMTYTAQLADTNGETSISVIYTNFFYLFAFPPCGYEATTPNLIEAKRKNAVGFAPINPQPGVADFYFLLWHDENQDGEYQSGEMPIAGEALYLDPGLPWRYGEHAIFSGALMTSTDSGGEAVANLGNSCGTLTVKIPAGWQLPNAEDKQLYKVVYQPGRTNVFLGVILNE